jgi:hypothetical protein
MIVSFPADAADTICCSMDLFILAVSDYIHIMLNKTHKPQIMERKLTCLMEACFTRAVFLGGICLFPFFGFAAALAACLEDEALL